MAHSEASRIKTWEDRIRSSGKLYNSWSGEFETKKLEEYYKGKQHRGISEEEAKKRYVINLVYSSIEVNKPSLVFDRPQVRVQSRPSRMEDFGSNSEARAKLCQDTVQTFIDDPDIGFDEEAQLALHEAHFRFGVIEVGYTADWTDNPDAGKPVLKEDNKTPVKDKSGEVVTHGDVTVTSESIFIKRIPAHTFRVSISNKNKLLRNDWCGYYEWQYLEDVKSNKNYQNTAQLRSTGTIDSSVRPEDDDNGRNYDDIEKHHGMVKIWKIYDLRRKVRHVIAEGHKKFLQEDRPFKFLPFAVIKFHDILDSFYPMPPVYNWLGPQDEINETREMQRAHRRRFYRRYTYRQGTIEKDELEKLENGGDGVYAEANVDDPLKPVADAPLSADVWKNLDESKTDFLAVSAVGGEQRGVAESDTATQASIIDQRARLRESAARNKVSKWLARIARLMLLTIRENMALPIMVKTSTDPFVEGLNATKVALWQEIKAEELEGTDLDFFIDLSSMSPVSEEAQRNSWNAVLALISNPTVISLLGRSEVLLRKTLTLYGIKSETEIQEIKRIMMEIQMEQAMAAQMAMMAGKPAGPGVGPQKKPTAAGGSIVTGDKLAAIQGAATQGGMA